MKKGQVTIYITIIIVIVLLLGMFFLIRDSDIPILQEDDSPITLYVENCLEETTKAGLLKQGLQGGYTENMPEEFVRMEYADVPYYYLRGDDLSPSLETLENELAAYIDANIWKCTGTFATFEEQGPTVTYRPPTTSVVIGDNDVSVNLNFPIEVSSTTETRTYDNFFYKIDVRLKEIHEVTQEIISSVFMHPRQIDQTLLLDLISEHDMQIDAIEAGFNTVNYVIDDKKSVLWEDTNVMFLFATMPGESSNAPVILNDEDYYSLMIGEELYFPIVAIDEDDDELTYFSNSTILNINKYDGSVRFIPEELGKFIVKFTVYDGKHVVDKDITFDVVELQ